MQPRVYLDWNASAPLRPEASSAMIEALACWGNPSSVHREGRAARAIVDRARLQLGTVFETDPANITFTSGATEAASLALAGRNLHSSEIEHDCVRAWTQPDLPVLECGTVQVVEPRCSAVQLANSETGVVQRLPAGLAACDATQAFGKIDVRQLARKVDVAFVSAHKIGGPKGVGAVVNFAGVELQHRVKGGGQEFGRRSGTENVAGIAGFAAAAVAAQAEVENGTWRKVEKLRDAMESVIVECHEDVVFFGKEAVRLPNTSCFAARGWKGEAQVIDMDLRGFSVSAGSACSSGKVAPSNVLRAMGVRGGVSDCAIRVSLGPSTKMADVTRFADTWNRRWRRIGRQRRSGEPIGWG
ncbi:MAG: aminotransferase class V-fold PLP-dependent enzyme [Rhodobacteraceae bacterium]|nr:aminotransferase class V-fold PLP-dependent enzyme [Paracoccaceae bacterium]